MEPLKLQTSASYFVHWFPTWSISLGTTNCSSNGRVRGYTTNSKFRGPHL